MARLVKILLILLAALVGVGLLASLALYLFFDPNDYRDNISLVVKETTGRELVIEGDLSLSIFPWIAVEIGRTRLGNAEGFGDEPFLSFDGASLSVRLMPLILSQEIAIGTASLDSLVVNLQVNRDGVSNWEDLSGGDEPQGSEVVEQMLEEQLSGLESEPVQLDISNVSVTNASVSYVDAQAGSSASITGLTLSTGRIAAGSPCMKSQSGATKRQQ